MQAWKNDGPPAGAETERQLLHALLERVAAELFALRREIGLYEGVVLTQLAGTDHDIGPELQSIDLSLQTLEEVAIFVRSLATMTDVDHHIDPSAFPMRFRLADVRRRLFAGHSTATKIGKASTVDLF